MNKIAKSLLVTSLLVSSVGLVTIASAKSFGDGPGCGRSSHHAGQGRHEGGKGRYLERLARRLNMTDEQRAEIETVLHGSREQMAELRDEMRTNRAQIRELVSQADFDETAVRGMADKQGDLKAEMIVLRARQRSEMKALLTDEQIAQLDEMRKGKYFRGHRH